MADPCYWLFLWGQKALREGTVEPRGTFLPCMRQRQAACQPLPQGMALPRNAHTTHTLLIFLANLCFLLGLPPSFLPSQPLLLISLSWNLGLTLYNSAANTKSCRKKKIQRNLTKKKKYINKKVPKKGGLSSLWGAMISNSSSLSVT